MTARSQTVYRHRRCRSTADSAAARRTASQQRRLARHRLRGAVHITSLAPAASRSDHERQRAGLPSRFSGPRTGRLVRLVSRGKGRSWQVTAPLVGGQVPVDPDPHRHHVRHHAPAPSHCRKSARPRSRTPRPRSAPPSAWSPPARSPPSSPAPVTPIPLTPPRSAPPPWLRTRPSARRSGSSNLERRHRSPVAFTIDDVDDTGTDDSPTSTWPSLDKAGRLAAQLAELHARQGASRPRPIGLGPIDRGRPRRLDRRGAADHGHAAVLAPSIKKIIMAESGGNPRAINTWDSNACRGTPSQGLMQTIPSTFRKFVHPACRPADHRPGRQHHRGRPLHDRAPTASPPSRPADGATTPAPTSATEPPRARVPVTRRAPWRVRPAWPAAACARPRRRRRAPSRRP